MDGKIDEALQGYNECLVKASEMNVNKYSLKYEMIYGDLGDLYLSQQNYAKSTEYYNKAIETAKGTNGKYGNLLIFLQKLYNVQQMKVDQER